MQTQLFIDGRFVDAVDRGTIDVLNPHDGSVITKIAAATAADVDRPSKPRRARSQMVGAAGCRTWPVAAAPG